MTPPLVQDRLQDPDPLSKSFISLGQLNRESLMSQSMIHHDIAPRRGVDEPR